MSNYRKPGRPPGNKQLRRLRSQTWLLAVRARSGEKSNCYLSRFFGPRDSHGNMLDTGIRLKMFEAIDKKGSIPGNGTGKRKFDLVAKVDSTEGYEGTAAIIHSPFWRLLENESLTLTEVREMIVECVRLLDLAKLPGVYQDDGLDELEELVSSEPTLTIEEYFERQKEVDLGYDLSMGDVLPYSVPSLDHIALVGALALEAILAGNMKIASYQIDIFRAYLKEYCNQEWLSKVQKTSSEEKSPKISDMLFQYAENRMLKALNEDALNGLPDYAAMLSNTEGANPNSAISALLTRHQRMLWRR